MSIEWVKEDWTKARANLKKDGHREYTRSFKVKFDSIQSGPVPIFLNPSIPVLWSTYIDHAGFYDLYARCQSLEPSATDEPQVWELTANYSTDWIDNSFTGGSSGGGVGSGSAPGSPPERIQKPTVVTWGKVDARVPITGAVNSAGEPFDPPPERDQARLSLQISRYQINYDANTMFSFCDAINDHNFLGFVAYSVKCKSISAVQEFERGTFLWHVTYDFELRSDLWTADEKILDRGTFYLDAGDGNKKKQFRTSTGQPRIGLLNGFGDKLVPDDPNNPAFVPIYKIVEIYEIKNFDLLSLP